MTYSILGRDPETGELGGAVQSHFFGVGGRALFLEPGVVAVASQAFSHRSHGPRVAAAVRGGERLRDPAACVAVLGSLIQDDPNDDYRQILLLSADGVGAGLTGQGCIPRAGHAVSDDVVVGGNTLRQEVCQAMIAAFQSCPGPLEERLLAALHAAEAAGGDLRGQMSAGLKVVGPQREDWPGESVRLDVRVDAHETPLDELSSLVRRGRAHRVLAREVLRPGVLVGTAADDRSAPEPAELVDRLLEAGATFGGDPEFTFWGAVMADAADDPARAVQLFHRAISNREDLAILLRNLVEIGRVRLHPDVLTVVLGSDAVVPAADVEPEVDQPSRRTP